MLDPPVFQVFQGPERGSCAVRKIPDQVIETPEICSKLPTGKFTLGSVDEILLAGGER